MQQTGKLNDAMIQAVRAQVFSRPLGSPWSGTPAQRQQGAQGQLGGNAGRTNGYIGGSVAQTGRQTQAAPKTAVAPTTPAPSPQGAQTPQFGLEHLVPLLGFLMQLFGGHLGMGGGMPGTTPQGQGKI